MTQVNTVTNDDELRTKIVSELAHVTTEYHYSGDGRETFDAVVNELMQLITADRAKSVLDGQIELAKRINNARSLDVDLNDTAWCQTCHMILEEGGDQDCACITIAEKLLTELQNKRKSLDNKT